MTLEQKPDRLEHIFFSPHTNEKTVNVFEDDSIAIRFFDEIPSRGDDDDSSVIDFKWTYKHVSLTARFFSQFLKEQFNGGGYVGLVFKDTSPLLPCLILGILEANSAFICLRQPSCFPNMATKLNLTFLFVENEMVLSLQSHCDNSLFELSELVFNLNELDVDLKGFEKIKLFRIKILSEKERKTASGVAYVMQTSGSTGAPKIVRVPHACIIPNIVDLRRAFFSGLVFPNSNSFLIFLASPLTFDPSVVEMFLSFATRSTLIMTSSSVRKSSKKLEDLLVCRYPVNFLKTTPSLLQSPSHRFLRSLLRTDSSVTHLVFGGEPCPSPRLLRHLKGKNNQTKIFNIYGITEVSCWASLQVVDITTDDDCVTIGEPLSETIVTLAKEENSSNENGDEAIGEILIGGNSRICLIDDEDQAIICESNQVVLRRTGDIGKRRKNGKIEIIGRADDQVKIFGQRVHLNQVRTNIMSRILSQSNDLCTLGQGMLMLGKKLKKLFGFYS